MKNLFISSILFVFGLTCSQGIVAPSSDLQDSIWKTEPGNSISISTIPKSKDYLPFTIQDSGPTLVFSDDPEYLKSEGICGQEIVSHETARVYLYNVNSSPTNYFKFSVVLKNMSDKEEKIVVTKEASINPSGNYGYIGKTTLLIFYKSNVHRVITIPPHQSAILDSKLDKQFVNKEALAHGIYEFYCPESTRISLCGLNYYADTLKTYESLSILLTNAKNAGRGTFPHSNRRFIINDVVDTKDGIQKIQLADGKIDPWIKGIDATTGKATQIGGNYGVLYSVDIKVKSSDNKNMAILLMSPTASANVCAYAGVVGTHEDYNLTTPGYFLTPADQSVFKSITTSSLAGVYFASDKEETITVEFSPPGASCLPADLILVPLERKN